MPADTHLYDFTPACLLIYLQTRTPTMPKTLATKTSKPKGQATSGPCANPLCRSGEESFLLCNGCKIVYYCNEDCQRTHWGKKGDPDRHKPVCKEVRAAAAAAAESRGGGGGGAKAGSNNATHGATPSTNAPEDTSKHRCTASQGGSGGEDGDEPEHPCPICLANEDDASVDGKDPDMCHVCGQQYCGACFQKIWIQLPDNLTVEALQQDAHEVAEMMVEKSTCALCREQFWGIDPEEDFKRLSNLVHGRSPGRHTPQAQFKLGMLYAGGNGTEKNVGHALKLFQLAADAAHVEALTQLGVHYNQGDGVEQDSAAAVRFFMRAAEHGSDNAAYCAGAVYMSPQAGLKRDYAAARKWFRRSDLVDAHYHLGKIAYLGGHGVQKDHSEARKYFQLVCKSSGKSSYVDKKELIVDAQCMLYDVCLRAGDTIEALRWLQLALDPGDNLPNERPSTKMQQVLFDVFDDDKQRGFLPPPPGTSITVVLLTSTAGKKLNNQTGTVVEPEEGTTLKPDRVAVVLDGERKILSFHLKHLKVRCTDYDGSDRGDIDEVDLRTHPCLHCTENEEDDRAGIGEDKNASKMCTDCGQGICGGCYPTSSELQKSASLAAQTKTGQLGQMMYKYRDFRCLACRALAVTVDTEVDHMRLKRLVYEKPPGRHTPWAHLELGTRYIFGVGVKKNTAKAMTLFQRAADEGSNHVLFQLGAMYEHGDGIKQDYAKARKLYRRAAEQGHMEAQHSLGTFYFNAHGVKQNIAEAYKWYRCAAEQGYDLAQFCLGDIHCRGAGVPQDENEIVKWWTLSAEQGYGNAEHNLGTMTKDVAVARKLFQRALEHGYTFGGIARHNLESLPAGPMPTVGTPVTVILLTSAAGQTLNNRTGKVVVPETGTTLKPGRVAVLLDGGGGKVVSFKLMNLRQ